MAEFDQASSALGIITPELMARFPAATYMMGRQAAGGAGGDVSDPRNVAKALQSRNVSGNISQLKGGGRIDANALKRVLGAPAPTFNVPGVGQGGTYEQNLDEGARVQTEALTRNIAGRGIAAREVLRENEKLAEFSRMDTAIDAREKKLKDKVLQGIERNILDIKNKSLAARAIQRSQLGHLSPAQRNAVLAAQSSVFTEQLQNLEALRSAREGAIDARVQDDRESLELQISGSEQKIKGLDAAIKIMEANSADASSIADIRMKLAQEREKLRKKGGGVVTRDSLVFQEMKKTAEKKLGRELSSQEISELRSEAKFIVESRKFDSVIDQEPNMSTERGPVYAGPDLGTALDFAGFGITQSRDELADMYTQETKRKTAEADLKLKEQEVKEKVTGETGEKRNIPFIPFF
jgi:hypothetical protein